MSRWEKNKVPTRDAFEFDGKSRDFGWTRSKLIVDLLKMNSLDVGKYISDEYRGTCALHMRALS